MRSGDTEEGVLRVLVSLMSAHYTHHADHPVMTCRQCLGQPYFVVNHEGESGTAGTYLGRCPCNAAINYSYDYKISGGLAWHVNCAPGYKREQPEYVAPSSVKTEPVDPEKLRKLFRSSNDEPIDRRRQLRK